MRTLLALVHELDAILQELARGVDELLDLVGHVEGLKRRWWDNGEVEGGWTVEQMDVEDGGGTDEGCTHKSSQLMACASVKLSSISLVRCHAGRIKNGPVLGRRKSGQMLLVPLSQSIALLGCWSRSWSWSWGRSGSLSSFPNAGRLHHRSPQLQRAELEIQGPTWNNTITTTLATCHLTFARSELSVDSNMSQRGGY